MRRWRLCLLAAVAGAAIALGGCGAPAASQDAENEPRTDAASEMADGTEVSEKETAPEENSGGHNILIAYFTRLDNTDGDIDTIMQGGGPYGTLGDSLEGADWRFWRARTMIFQGRWNGWNTKDTHRVSFVYTGKWHRDKERRSIWSTQN